MNLNEIFKDPFIALIFVSVTVASWHVSNTLNTTTIASLRHLYESMSI